MKYSDATKLIDACHRIACCDGNMKVTVKLLDEMAEALYKQVPQKIVNDNGKYHCICSQTPWFSQETAERLFKPHGYCIRCGQRLEL